MCNVTIHFVVKYELLSFYILFCHTVVFGDLLAYLCTKRLLSRYASAALSWYEYKMRLAKSRLYFLTWRKDRNCGEQSEKKNRERDIRERKSNNFERKN